MKKIFLYTYLIIFATCQLSCGNRADKTITSIPENKAWEKLDSLLALIKEPIIPEKEYLFTDFGGIGDGITDNKGAFDRVIKKCDDNGGGKIIVSPGHYIVNGPIHLKSNINLHLQMGSKISFGNNPIDYLPVVLTSWEGTRLYNYSPFVYAFQQNNIAISGEGEIDGEASETWSKWKNTQDDDKLLSRRMNNEHTPLEDRRFGEGHFLRPHLIQFYECENILVDGIKITDAPFWCLHTIYSKNITVRNVRFDAQNANNDGIDPESSENVLIENITFNNRDDNIAIKSGRDLEARTLNRPSKNIIIRKCKMRGHNAVAIGSEMSGGVHDIYVEKCSFAGEVMYGIYIKGNLDRGGEVRDIHVRNMEFDVTRSLIMVDSYYKKQGSCCPPAFKNIFIENVSCNATGDYGISLVGSDQQHLNNIRIKNVIIKNAAKAENIVNVDHLFMEDIVINGKDYSKTIQ